MYIICAENFKKSGLQVKYGCSVLRTYIAFFFAKVQVHTRQSCCIDGFIFSKEHGLLQHT